ncbi:MAG: lipocalin-like domain-containing protein [Candidatus Aminicenantes bacterium]|nr:MAG: lipocalin-like domain-containing protein [Candidatus Aminicenantes bacterium]
MKKLFMILPMVVLLCFAFGCQQGEEVAAEPAVDVKAEDSSSIVGTYIYELEDQEGIAIWTETHFIYLLTSKMRMPFKDEEPTESEKAAAFTSLTADGGTYTFSGPSRITVHRLFSSDPNLVGTEFMFDFEIDGDSAKYWIIQPDGSRGPEGRSRKIK